MANLKNLQERIKSVSSIQQVTKAMKMVAAAKVKKGAGKDGNFETILKEHTGFNMQNSTASC